MTPTNDNTRLGLEIGETRELTHWRIHRWADHLTATDLTNAGKRGKKVRELRLRYYGRERDMPIESVTLEILLHAGRGASLDRMIQTFREIDETTGGEFSAIECRGVDVEPAGVRLHILTEALEIDATTRAFHIVDRLDHQNGAMAMQPADGPVRAAVRFRAWLDRNAERVRSMRFGEVMRELHAAGIGVHQWCSVD